MNLIVIVFALCSSLMPTSNKVGGGGDQPVETLSSVGGGGDQPIETLN